MHVRNRSSYVQDEWLDQQIIFMNFLAHAFLSFNDAGILTGNMISDFVKGKKKFDLPENIQQGILLHRKIDTYTDDHLANKELKLIFRPHYGLYCSPIMDVLFDHFLACDENIFSEDSLRQFTADTYNKLDEYQEHFPERFARMFPYMKSQNWLYHYRSMEGVWNSLGGLARRAKYLGETSTAFALFEDNYETLRAGYNEFFPELREMAFSVYQEITGRENV
ncbi:MAG TPA: ACP phosphodiesterase [Chitinophagaceae bacterium]|nr:ACP phosphodiesterase [Chitinophagaceae bacterium]